MAAAAACVIGPKTIGTLIDRLMKIDEKAQAAGKWDEASGREYHALLGMIMKCAPLGDQRICCLAVILRFEIPQTPVSVLM